MLRLVAIETVRIEEHPNVLWVRLLTNEGLVGLGETFFGAKTVEAYIHEYAAPRLLKTDPLQIGARMSTLSGYLGARGTGAELRGNSAIDLALWDLFGKVTNLPLWQLLGGKCRERIRTYNTCAGPQYVRSSQQQAVSNWGTEHGRGGRYDDLNAFLERADELALDLLESGVTAMKIWPFDQAAERTTGQYISAQDMRRAIEPIEKIRRAVGDRMDIMVEFHSLWQLLPAIQIAEALEPYGTFWHEDPIRLDSLATLRQYAERSRAPLCASETLGTRWAFRDLLETGVPAFVMLDLAWCGGLSEASKIAAMAETWHLPVTPHDCTGPVVLAASTHFCLHASNALVQESVRAFYHGWYAEVASRLPVLDSGFLTPPDASGHGVELHADLDRKFTVHRAQSST